MSDLRPYDALLLDIEGTTTSIAFVYDVLFPYARAHVSSFLEGNWGSLLAERKLFDDAGLAAETPSQLAATVLSQMDADLKTTALKSLQGRIWAAGYADGTLLADVFDDVPGALRRWCDEGKVVCIYSSGSVAAQRLLFGHTHHGSLMPLLSGFFDTTTGPKREAESYRDIAAAMGFAPGQILFATDVVPEADAAVAAGMQAVIMDRPGNRPQPAHEHAVRDSFEGI